MKKIRLIWQLYPSFLVIILLALFAVGWYTSKFVRTFYLDQTGIDLLTQARLLEKQFRDQIAPVDATAVDRLCKDVGDSTSTRVTVILPNGIVVGDSREDPQKMDNHSSRPEIVDALTGRVGSAMRYSGTLRQHMMYVATPLEIDGTLHAVLRTSIPITALDQELGLIQSKIALCGFLIALLASVICLFISRRIIRPIEQMKKGALHFAAGDLNHRLQPTWTAEMASLGQVLNQMAGQLAERIEIIRTQRNEYEAVLASMVEGVVALDLEDRILNLNQAAAEILDLTSRDQKKRSIQEIVRSNDLNAFLSNRPTDGTATQADIVIRQNGDRILNAHSIPMRNAEDKHIGRLIVLHDVTEIRKLENVRRDFVANVSHEIKTPLTAIKGFVETLAHCYDDQPEQTDKFLNIIKKHADRLDAIVEDLLALARLERQEELGTGRTETCPVRQLVETAVQVVQPQADAKKIVFDLNCDTTTVANVDTTLLEQALVNLVDNAVKYSPDQSRVAIETQRVNEELVIQVCDNGPGIPKKHQARLFERFYRVDKARSRDQGGTGLGLAIVKHIVQSHKGRVTVDSTAGRGSTFSIFLPAELIVDSPAFAKHA